MDRHPILVIVLVFTGLLAILTVTEVIQHGPDPLTILSLLVLGLFGFGIVGALRQPPDE
jgi:hypothetical protein